MNWLGRKAGGAARAPVRSTEGLNARGDGGNEKGHHAYIWGPREGGLHRAWQTRTRGR